MPGCKQSIKTMSNSHILLLKSSVGGWNQWRRQHPNAPCCLSNVDLSRGYFYEADFSHVDLSGANLSRACLIGANFQNADLTGANLSNAYVDNANFDGATLKGARLVGTNIKKPNLSQVTSAHTDTGSANTETASIFQRLRQPIVWLPTLATVGIVAAVAMSGIASVERSRQPFQAAGPETTSPSPPAQLASSPSSQPANSLSMVKSLEGSSQIWSVVTHVRADGRVLVVSGNAVGQIKVWDAPTGEILHTLSDQGDAIRALALSAAGDRLVSGSGDGIKVWQPQTGDLLYALSAIDDSPVWSLAVSPDGRTFISGDYDGNITAWDLESGEPLYRTRVDVPVWSIAIAPDGSSFVTASDDRTIRQWDLADGQLIKEFVGHQDAVRAVTISPDGQTLASGSWDSTIKLWDLGSGELKETLTGHRDRVVSLAISPDGNMLASSSIDKTLKTWDIPSAQLIETLDRSSDWVLAVAFDPKETTLVSGGKDQTIKIWQ